LELQISNTIATLLGPELRGLAWLLTYSIHAAVWAIAASLTSKWQSLSAAMRHTAWKGALLAPFFTTLLAFATPWALEAQRTAISRAPHVSVVAPRDAPEHEAQAGAAPSPRLKLDETSARRLGRGLDLLGAGALGAAALGLLRLGVSAAVVARRLARRRTLTDGRLFELLRRVRTRFALGTVTLSESAEVACPLVLGGSEICIPLIGLAELSDAEVEAVFAHELAHLERGDGFWFPVVGTLESALWFHPVTRWGCARVRQSAELACDARCVELTGEPRALALALTRIASRAVATKRALVLPTMTHPRSGLVARVAQLTSTAGPDSFAAPRARAKLIIGLALVAVVNIGFSVRVADARVAATHVGGPADLAKLSQEVNALAAQQLVLEAELQKLSSSPADRASGLAASARALDIEQELRHAREMQQWLEQRLVNE